MAIGDVVKLNSDGNAVVGEAVIDESFDSSWAVAHTKPELAEPDAGVISGGKVVRPDLIANAEQHFLLNRGLARTLSLMLRYDDAATGLTDPVVRVYGVDRNGQFFACKDSTGAVEITLATATSADVQDGTYKYTDPRDVNIAGAHKVIVAVQTAFAASGGTVTNSAILARLKPGDAEAH